MKRVLHVSDPHLRRGEPRSYRGWQDVVALVRTALPDLVIDTGDLVFDSPDATEDHAFAAACHRDLGVDVVLVPGNHDIGDGPPKATGPREDLATAFLARYGQAHWVRHLEDWALIGVNAMLFGSGQAGEADEWAWIERTLASNCDRPIALFVHKPPFLVSPDETTTFSAAMPIACRERFWSLVKRHDVQLIGCGHRHEYRCVAVDGVLIVWAPTTTELLSEDTPPLVPHAHAGLVEYLFSGRSVVHRPILFGR